MNDPAPDITEALALMIHDAFCPEKCEPRDYDPRILPLAPAGIETERRRAHLIREVQPDDAARLTKIILDSDWFQRRIDAAYAKGKAEGLREAADDPIWMLAEGSADPDVPSVSVSKVLHAFADRAEAEGEKP